MGKAGAYTRLSVYDGRSESTDRQEQDCRQLASVRGDELVKVYTDLDLSGWSGVERPAFEELLADAEAGSIDTLYIWKIDRLTRNFDDLQRVWRLVQQRGLKLVSVTDSLDTSSPMGVFGLRMMVAAAELESLNTSIRTKRAKRASAEAGKPHTGGYRPLGYTDGSRTAQIPAEADAARECVRRLLAGEALRSVTRWMNDEGTLAPTGKPWTPTVLANALTRPSLAGLRAYKGELYPGQWEPVISPEEHHQLVALRADPARLWQQPGMPRVHLLAGLLVCGRKGCGMKLLSKRPSRSLERYECKRVDARGCGKLTISAPKVEQVVLDRLWEALDSDALRQALVSRPDAALARQLQADEAQLAWLGQTLGADPLKRPAFLAAVGEVEGRIRQARARMARQHRAQALGDLAAGVDKVKAAWDGWGLERRRQLLLVCIDRVIVHPSPLGRKQGRAFDRSRVEVVWRV
jgi:DNA invertase Pin-like site-specific DNA recombinase